MQRRKPDPVDRGIFIAGKFAVVAHCYLAGLVLLQAARERNVNRRVLRVPRSCKRISVLINGFRYCEGVIQLKDSLVGGIKRSDVDLCRGDNGLRAGIYVSVNGVLLHLDAGVLLLRPNETG
jgi:hypothetical protein